MAKQLGVIQFRGKLGQTVGAKRAAGQKSNIIRAKADTVANPKTIAQRNQRVKMTPAVNFYRALVGILDHSFQSAKYGAPSQAYFMSKALRMESGFPFLVKGDTRAVPGEYMISQGGLASVGASFDSSSGTLLLPVSDDATATESAFADYLINRGVCQNGDQLTFVFCHCSTDSISDDDAMFYYTVYRYVLNAGSSVALGQELYDMGLFLNVAESRIEVVPANMADGAVIVGGALILSRPPRSEGGAWQRSTEYLQVSSDVFLAYMSARAQTAALESYAGTVSEPSSDWFLNGGNNGSDSASVLKTVSLSVKSLQEDGTTPSTSVGGTVSGAGAYPNGAQVTVQASVNGNFRFEGWYTPSGSRVSTSETYSFTLNGDAVLEARFIEGTVTDQP